MIIGNSTRTKSLSRNGKAKGDTMTTDKKISQIVKEEDLQALESYCQFRTYRQVICQAQEEDVDLEHLEELLWEIS